MQPAGGPAALPGAVGGKPGGPLALYNPANVRDNMMLLNYK